MAYLRLTSNQPQVTINIFTDAEGDFRAQLIPLPRSGSIAPSPDLMAMDEWDSQTLVLFAGAYGTHSGQANFDSKYDLDGDGRVGFSDFVLFANAYGKPVRG